MVFFTFLLFNFAYPNRTIHMEPPPVLSRPYRSGNFRKRVWGHEPRTYLAVTIFMLLSHLNTFAHVLWIILMYRACYKFCQILVVCGWLARLHQHPLYFNFQYWKRHCNLVFSKVVAGRAYDPGRSIMWIHHKMYSWNFWGKLCVEFSFNAKEKNAPNFPRWIWKCSAPNYMVLMCY